MLKDKELMLKERLSPRTLSASLTAKILQEKGIEATTKLSESPNAKVIIIGSGKDGLNHFGNQ